MCLPLPHARTRTHTHTHRAQRRAVLWAAVDLRAASNGDERRLCARDARLAEPRILPPTPTCSATTNTSTMTPSACPRRVSRCARRRPRRVRHDLDAGAGWQPSGRQRAHDQRGASRATSAPKSRCAATRAATGARHRRAAQRYAPRLARPQPAIERKLRPRTVTARAPTLAPACTDQRRRACRKQHELPRAAHAVARMSSSAAARTPSK